ncbi:hydroxymethylbilane synthase [Rhizobium brockwellii]|uniref:hydroxymethylbilane synthase n=1 Tax=Rhizobium brockwellii TaxID=3019932 RepID=UPI00067B12D4|nr:hydroxymethylbilane synthase [Rhizobium brockwellii]KPN22690.1 hypothetical protein KS05_31910 [Rhizobium brockwellii]QJX09991.1 hydroxymethylbilane synthase [Rhizobium brockwellii]
MVHLRIGCRGSRLAKMQTDQAGDYICQTQPGTSFEKVEFTTSGDKIAGSLKRAGGKGLFVRELDVGLKADKINLAIHCLKDMPGNEPLAEGTRIAGYLPRADAGDVLISTGYRSIADLPQGAKVGTTAPRRIAQLRAIRPDLQFDFDYRGAIDTRIKNMREKRVDATLLAAAGLDRASLWEDEFVRLSVDDFLPAMGQGTLALQCRDGDDAVFELCRAATCADAEFAALAERQCLKVLDGDCFSAIAGICEKKSEAWVFTVAIFGSRPGEQVRSVLVSEADEGAEAFGKRIAEDLIGRGGKEFVERGFLEGVQH